MTAKILFLTVMGLLSLKKLSLFKLGYTVRQDSGLKLAQIREILEEAYSEKELPWCNSDEYMENWGASQSIK